MFSLNTNNPSSGLRVAFLVVFIGFYHTFALYIVKLGMIAPHGVSLVNSDKLISRLNSH